MFLKERPQQVKAIFFDRDNTLIKDVPYNGDPDLVEPMPTALETIHLLRSMNIPVGVISNQSGIGRGILTPAEVLSVNAKVDEIFSPFEVWRVCPHTPQDECICRKPQPTMLVTAAMQLGLEPKETAYIGDIGTDVEAAENAGAKGILVPTEVTKQKEIDSAEIVADTLLEAVKKCLSPEIERVQ